MTGDGVQTAWQASEPCLYVHLPFCAQKCHYCDFTAYFNRDPRRIDRYLDHLERECRLWAQQPSLDGVVFRTLYLGGGTPSLLSVEQFERLLDMLEVHFTFTPSAERTLEANPEDLTEAKLACWRRRGFGRLSIGAQAAQPALLSTLGRKHGWREVVDGFARARAAGFTNLNLDLMFGLPGQTLADWRRTLAAVLALAPTPPEHLSCYGLQVEDGTPFGRWQREGRLPLPPDDETLQMDRLLTAELAAAGYRHYELSNFARPGFESQHNLNYWTMGSYLGLGAGASSLWQGERFTNHRRLGAYGAALEAGRLPVAERDRRGLRTQMAEMIMLGTRLLDGLPRERFRLRFGCDPEHMFAQELADLEQRGLLQRDAASLRLTALGRRFANDVWLALL